MLAYCEWGLFVNTFLGVLCLPSGVQSSSHPEYTLRNKKSKVLSRRDAPLHDVHAQNATGCQRSEDDQPVQPG